MKHSIITRATATAASAALLAFAATGVSAAQGADTNNPVWPAGYGQYSHNQAERTHTQTPKPVWPEGYGQYANDTQGHMVQQVSANPVWPRGYGQYANNTQNVADNTYRKGDRVPAQLRDRNHVVTDLQAHGLNQPPQGYRWIRDPNRGDFLLIDQKSGVVFAVTPA